MTKIPITVAHGDGIGPEIMAATLKILEEAGAPLDIHEIEVGEKVYNRGILTGMAPETWDIIRNTKAFLKGPITTPQGGGFRSLNVAIRTTLGLYANVRPCVSYHPFVQTKHPVMDIVVIRENEEDLYSGIEYQQTPDVTESIKIISRQGSEKIVRYAFEYARHHGRKRVTAFVKDNIMKISDGLFSKVFHEIAKEYKDIEHDHWIVDIGAAKIATTPEEFDVVVMPNLYGDIISDITAQISGSVGLAGSANIGTLASMFEAIHGSAPRRAGENSANPSGLLHGALLMLDHIGEREVSARIHNAWLTTIEQGIHTYDISREGVTKKQVGTKEFGLAVCANLGEKPKKLNEVTHSDTSKRIVMPKSIASDFTRELVGTDIYIFSRAERTNVEESVQKVCAANMRIKFISNRGVKVWPEGQPETDCVEQWRCRFMHKEPGTAVSQQDIVKLLSAMVEEYGFDVIKIQNIYTINGKPAYSSADL